MRVELEVNYGIPEHMKPWVKDLVTYMIPLFPHWCNKMEVVYDPEEGNAAMMIKPSFRYRCCTLTICPKLELMSNPDKVHAAVHEACHVILGPLHMFVAGIMDRMDKGPAYNTMYDHFMEALEGTTEDLANVLQYVSSTDYQEMKKSVISYAEPE